MGQVNEAWGQVNEVIVDVNKSFGSVITHVANASGRPLRVYYGKDKMNLAQIESEYGTRASRSRSQDASTSVSECGTHISYIYIPPWEVGKILKEGDIYVTVFVENSREGNDCELICKNFFVPSNRSCIVTANHIKFQKYGANIWVDEQGCNHSE